jgi:putative CocE/NonD family hydrolase
MAAMTIPIELAEVDWSGAFRPARRVHWLITAMAPDLRRREGGLEPHTPEQARRIWNELEQGRRLAMLPWADLSSLLPESLARPLRQWMADPLARHWRLDEAHREIDVPNLDITGWFDHCNATIRHLGGMKQNARTLQAREQSRLIIGPWTHVTIGQREIAGFDFGPAGGADIHLLLIRWFDRWLRELDNGVEREPTVRYFVLGSQRWKAAETWPPPGLRQQNLYLRAHSMLAFDAPPGDEPDDSYIYDPRDPVPTPWSRDLFTEPFDRRRLDYRSDVLRYRTPPLEEDLEVVGEPQAVLHAASSAPDTDFFVRLVDEPPEGAALEISQGMVRARHRNGMDRHELLVPEEPVVLRIRMGPIACLFKKGHRIRLEITSSDFPNHDRNHNTGRNDMIETELIAACQRVLHSHNFPSYVILGCDVS